MIDELIPYNSLFLRIEDGSDELFLRMRIYFRNGMELSIIRANKANPFNKLFSTLLKDMPNIPPAMNPDSDLYEIALYESDGKLVGLRQRITNMEIIELIKEIEKMEL